MTIKTLDLKAAAAFLQMTPEGLRRKVVKGEIPGAKPGKRWCFREDDLALYLRSIYTHPAKVSWGALSGRNTTWHSTKEEIRGGLESVTKEHEYNKALGLQKKQMRKEFTTS